MEYFVAIKKSRVVLCPLTGLNLWAVSVKKIVFWAGEMAEWLKYLLLKYEDVNSDSPEKCSLRVTACLNSPLEGDDRDPQSKLTCKTSLIDESSGFD